MWGFPCSFPQSLYLSLALSTSHLFPPSLIRSKGLHLPIFSINMADFHPPSLDSHRRLENIVLWYWVGKIWGDFLVSQLWSFEGLKTSAKQHGKVSVLLRVLWLFARVQWGPTSANVSIVNIIITVVIIVINVVVVVITIVILINSNFHKKCNIYMN